MQQNSADVLSYISIFTVARTVSNRCLDRSVHLGNSTAITGWFVPDDLRPLHCLNMSGANHPATQHHIPGRWCLKRYSCESWKTHKHLSTLQRKYVQPEMNPYKVRQMFS